MAHPALADGPDLAEIRAALAKPDLSPAERSRLAREGASLLDRSAQDAHSSEERRARWSEAVALLDQVFTKDTNVPSAPLLQFQAAVYRWAEGRSLADRAGLEPADKEARLGAIRAFDDSIRRLRAVAVKPDSAPEAFAQNYRYRLARAIADRAEFEPKNDDKRAAQEREAIGLLDPVPTDPGLRPFALLLRAELSARLGSFAQSQIEVEQAAKLVPPPPEPALLEARVVALDGRGLFADARKAIDASKVPDPLKGLLRVRVELASRREKPFGEERHQADARAFREAERFKGATSPEGRKALIELARTIDEPGDDAPAGWWDLLAEGHLRLGEPVRAARLVEKGGDRAEAAGLDDLAATLRTRSGAYLFDASRFAEADASLSKVVDSPKAPREAKARAGMLRALARGRALATRAPGANRAAYLAALEGQVRDFPDLQPTGEARWLLGRARLASGKVDEALALWAGVRHDHPRWLEARLAIADRLREAVEDQRINRDPGATASKMDAARKSLRDALAEALEGSETVALTLRLALLELIPGAGRPNEALLAAETVLRSAASPDQHREARLDRMVALAEVGRLPEAEQIARAEARSAPPADLLRALRLLDRSAREVESETIRRRIGLVSKAITSRMVDTLDSVPAPLRDEARLHHARALLLSGDPAGSKREIADWGGFQEGAEDELLRELADAYQRLDAFTLAVDVERYRSSKLTPGSPPWFESQYGLALAYFRGDKPDEARRIIDAIAILHPELGGGELKTRFERLRQRIGGK